MPHYPNLYPSTILSRLTCGISAPFDLPDLLVRLPQADLYLQDEVQFAFHPTLTRVWSRKGRRGQRLIEAPGDNRKVYGFGLVDWRDGWFDGRIAPGRTADLFCEQVRAAAVRSQRRGRVAIVIADNLRTHTPAGSLLVRSLPGTSSRNTCIWCIRLPMTLMLIALNGTGSVSRRMVTHNHQRSSFELLRGFCQRAFSNACSDSC